MTASDFAGLDYDFAVGEVYGLRVWKMDDYGRLRARNWDKAGPWKPGINNATCHADGDRGSVKQIIDPSGRGRVAIDATPDLLTSFSKITSGGILGLGRTPTTDYGLGYRITWNDGSSEVLRDLKYDKPVHVRAPHERCACGFYAYSDPKHEETAGNKGTRNILGVIRGTGRTLIGTKGFRCEHAEIVALRDPTRGGRSLAGWRKEQRAHLERVYPDVPLLASRAELLQFAPITATVPEPSDAEFWALP